MKRVMFDDLYTWSVFNEEKQFDFNGYLWVREQGNILIDPVPMSARDAAQLDALGGAALNHPDKSRPRAGRGGVQGAHRRADRGARGRRAALCGSR